ncbi:MAG: hypothetical protein LBS50_11695 [Prevotellaceae bacterium]|jgi:hypothetical protein|nr:hypothetical protein [Prevotellaceae bacterium]
MKKIILFFCLLSIFGCKKSTKTIENYRDISVDSIFKIIDCIDTHKLNNTIIFRRHKKQNLYLLGNSSGNNSLFYVYVKENNIIEYDSLKNNYLTQQEIESKMNEYLTFRFPRIMVDSLENIYVNPYEFESIVFIKKVSNQLVFYQNYALFYKNNWYVLDKDILLQLKNNNIKFGNYQGKPIKIR